jgi:hypothetical protein
MDNSTIDTAHTRAICDEIGERLQTLLRSSTTDDAADFDGKLHQLSDGEVEG